MMSYFFLRPKAPDVANSEKEIIAYIQFTINDVQKKTPGRVIWQEVIKGDRLYKGDIIRTSVQSSATVNFLAQNVHFEVGPETTILIEKEMEGFNLDVLKGDLFLKSADKDSQLTVKANDLKMLVSGASLGVTVEKKGSVGVQVFEGSALVLGENRKTVIEKNRKLEIVQDKIVIKPLELFVKNLKGQNPILIHPTLSEIKVELDGADLISDIKFYAGENKTALENFDIQENGRNAFLVKVRPGPKYWKVVGKMKDKTVETALFYNQFYLVPLPQIISPIEDEFIYLKNAETPILLKWGRSTLLENALVEVATDADFKNIIFSDSAISTNYNLLSVREAGKYFWRIRGQVEGLGSLLSRSSSFRFKYGEGLIPPRQYLPENDAQLTTEDSKEGVLLTWGEVQDAKSYSVYVTRDNAKTAEYKATTNSFKVLNLDPGVYNWKVMAQSGEGKKSELSEGRLFRVVKLPQILFEKFQPEIFLDGLTNSFPISWKRLDSKESIVYRLLVCEKNRNENIEENLNESSWIFRPVREGIYDFKVIALNNQNRVVGLSNSYPVVVKNLPLLSAPKFSPKTKETKVTDGFGNLPLHFDAVVGAQYYLVEVKTISGKIVKVVQFEKTSGILEGLLPGTYEIGIKTVDKHNRQGMSGELLIVDVPSQSGLSKPRLNKVQVR